jgi:hypothetical protein
MQVRVHVDVVEKVAETPSELDRLHREAATLRAAAHPGVVRLVAAADDRLTLNRIDGPTLSEVAQRSSQATAAWGAALCTTVGDLHDIGCVHTAICADHVILDQGGHPVLCGLGNARWPSDAVELAALALADRNATVAIIAESFAQLASTPTNSPLMPGPRLGRLLVARRQRRFRRSDTGLRDLAKSLAAHAEATKLATPPYSQKRLASKRLASKRLASKRLASKRLASKRPTSLRPVKLLTAIQRPTSLRPDTLQPDTLQPDQRPRTSSVFAKPWKLAGAACIIVASAVLGVDALGGSNQSDAHLGSQSAQTLTVVGPSGPLELLSSSSGAMSISAGRWSCGVVMPAVLQVSSGQIWIFAKWPSPTQREVGHLLTRLRGAVSLWSTSKSAGCDTLMATTTSGGSVVVATGSSR